MELSRITAMVELLGAENGRVTQTAAANLAGAGLPCTAERFRALTTSCTAGERKSWWWRERIGMDGEDFNRDKPMPAGGRGTERSADLLCHTILRKEWD